MDEMQIFSNDEFGKVRIVMIDSDPWFVGKDVAAALGYADTKSALSDHVDDEDKQIVQRGQIATLEIPNRGLTIINESGVYSLIFGSRLKSAKRFKLWVTGEVLPAIRKTGRYEMEETVKPTVEPTRPLTTDDYIKASHIISLSKKETLPYTIFLLGKAGIELPKVQDYTRGEREFADMGFTASASVMEYLKSHEVEDRASGEVYRDYVDFCDREALEAVNHIVFSKQVNRLMNTRTLPIKVDGKTVRVFIVM